MKKEYKVLLVLAIVIFLVSKNQLMSTYTKEVSCFDYLDNDGDGLWDLDDDDCMSEATLDYDGDGYLNIDEYEAGTDVHNPQSIPHGEFQ